jgi:hypothetical protein
MPGGLHGCAEPLGLDLGTVPDLVQSRFDWDHTGGAIFPLLSIYLYFLCGILIFRERSEGTAG